MASGGTCGCHTGRATGPNHEGTSTADSYPPTLQVVPAATPMSCPLGEVCVPSMRRQIWLSCVAAAGLGNMNRCSSVNDFSTPFHTLKCGYSTHDQTKRSIPPAGIQLSNAVNDDPCSVSPMTTTGGRRGRLPTSP